jgi:hypothetical protein
MMSKLMRQHLTRNGYALIEQRRCVYCGNHQIKPFWCRSSGRTVNLDHFIPLIVLIKAWPTIIPNFLLRSCSRCNNRLNYQLFATFVDKFHYIRMKLQPQWSLTDNPAFPQLINIEIPDELITMIRPIYDVQDGDDMIELNIGEQVIKSALRPGANPSAKSIT